MANLFKSFTKSVKHWYLPLILGILLILCGIYIFSSPLETYLTLSILFSISFLISGALDIFFAIQNSKSLNGWGWYLTSGILTFIMGCYLVVYPAISITILPFFAGFTLLFRSIQLLGFSFDLKDIGATNWSTLTILSILGIILSFMLIANPIFSGLSIVVLTAMSFIFAGFASISLSLSLKKIKNYPAKLSSELKKKIEDLKKEIDSSIEN